MDVDRGMDDKQTYKGMENWALVYQGDHFSKNIFLGCRENRILILDIIQPNF